MRLYKLTSSKTWRVDIRMPDGRRYRWPLQTTSKKIAQGYSDMIEALIACQIRRELPGPELSAVLERCPKQLKEKIAQAGLVSSHIVTGSESLTVLLDAFKASLENRGKSKVHIKRQYDRAKAVCEGIKATFFSDIHSDQVLSYIAGLEMTVMTQSYYLGAIKQFCHWMIKSGKASQNPLNGVGDIDTSQHEKNEYRPLTQAEMVALLDATRRSDKTMLYMDGPERYVLYLLASETGLRSGELNSLKVGDFNFKHLTVEVGSTNTKNRKKAVLPLRESTAELLKAHFGRKLPQSKAFGFQRTKKLSEVLQEDCKAANIETKDNGSGRVVFYSLRHGFATALAESGVHPRTAQELMRHSDINLTMQKYTHVLKGNDRAAVERLPDFQDAIDRQQMKMTGTLPAENTLPCSLPFGRTKQDKNGHSVDNIPDNSIDDNKNVNPYDSDSCNKKTTGHNHMNCRHITGERGDSNPRPPGPQPGALTN